MPISVSIAALAAALPVGEGAPAAPAEFRLLPLGRFRTADGSGRPEGVAAGWLLDAAAAQAVADEFNARADARVIDYEHQTLSAENNGQPAPAAGWIGRLEARADGLYAVGVEWTARAAAMIAAREYRYISPVFVSDKRSGRVLRVLHAALTNFAGLDGLTDLSALAARFFPAHQEEPMKDLLKALGLPETATEAEALAALAALKSAHQGELSALRAQAPDPAQYVSIATLTAVRGELAAAAAELAALKAKDRDAEVNKVVTEALAAGKLTPATEAWARDLGKSDLAKLTAYVAAAPVVVAPGQSQTGGQGPAGQSHQHADVDLAVMKALGLTAEQFAAGMWIPKRTTCWRSPTTAARPRWTSD